eukprot:GFUD01044219.1.p1 GENE.GFUD01044219.1~~GFUD01044219.1.p1  ORF type:complete len:479 (-),score=86.52 GFUD01044219.1:200-1636(-)
MNTALKQLVSKKKRRYKADGYNLDLSYVTDRVIAMGFPSESVESIFRNSLDEVRRFLEDKHENHYKIYNLCSERSYDIQKFHSRVAVYPFDDHSPPEFGQMLPFCCDVAQWLGQDEEHVAVVHCKAGKGRTGLMICAFLLYSKMFTTAEDVLEFYGSARTFDSNGVTIPSQRRYVDYFATKLLRGLQFEYSPVKMFFTNIIIQPPPHVGFGHHSAHLQFQILQPLIPTFLSEAYTVDLTKSKIILELSTPLLLSGDVKIAFSQKINVDLLHLSAKPKFLSHIPHGKLFHFWFNTFFIDLQHSSPLSHDLSKATGIEGLSFPSLEKLPVVSVPSSPTSRKHFPRSSYSRRVLFKPTPIKNRFAALSLPNLPAQFLGDGPYTRIDQDLTSTIKCPYKDTTPEPATDMVQLPPGCEMAVRLRKDQIDKASKEHSGKFADDFTVTLVVIKPDDQTQVYDDGCKPSDHSQSLSTSRVRCGGRE